MTNPLHPPVPPVSKKDMPVFNNSTHRSIGGLSFNHGSNTYDDVRPGYPPEVLDLIGHGRIVDIGAGTGKLAGLIANRGRNVLALDPSMDMLKVLRQVHPEMPCWQATAEETSIKTASIDVITCAQTWHWVDVEAASKEFDRILRPNGEILLVWNNLDTSIAWVHRLSRIMHAGDVLKPGFIPPIAHPWIIGKTVRTTWNQKITPEQLLELAHTRSYWLRASTKIRDKVDSNLRWYLYEHLGFKAGQIVNLPYRCDAFLLLRNSSLN